MTGWTLNAFRSLALLLILSGVALGEDVPDLYVAETPVLGQGSEARASGIRETFAKVLVKVSGDPSLPGKSGLSKALKQANNYVQQYAYRPLGQVPQTDTDNEAVPDRLLRVKFDESAINRLLQSHGVPVWSSARPATLIWLGIEIDGQRSLFQPELNLALREALAQVADSRGLPLLFPLMDLEDRANLQVSDVWGGFAETISQASERYQPDVILVGRLRNRSGDAWEADWILYQPDTKNNWQSRNESRQGVAVAGLHQAVDNLAARFAPQNVGRGKSKLRVRVSGLNHLADYLLVKDYLGSLQAIQSLELFSASPNEVSFLVSVQGGRETLERGIMLGRVLESVPPQERLGGVDAGPVVDLDAESLNYRLRQ
jgi:hypothetical protein